MGRRERQWWGYSHPHSRSAVHLLFWLLVGGVLGAAYWWFRGRHAPLRSGPVRVAQGVVAGLAVGLILVGTTWRSVTDLGDAPICAAPPGEEWGSTAEVGPLTVSVAAQKVATWPETGLAMLYADARGLTVCRYAAADYYVGVVSKAVAGKRTTNFGDMVVSPRFPTVPSEAAALAEHESHHRPQWAVATVLAGPAAFPVAYGVDDFFFPGARNHFERLAGLAAGGYEWEGAGPVLGVRQVLALVLVLAAGTAGVVRRRRRARAG
ncbi:hypothetical protein [Kineococcus rhizosphaerae]|uniref:Uncharacterized protein n=1 Tax=Kineococcus rhizosphaerae TaxID=559628 RepID=A0A2T0QYZ0_9ACTN|nr:hypothetical protein [Kineococcus rhizosphaerae]PRY11735.1 hypothetical protein CLV37_11233 [Kineococcus rhizosphaerae]